MTNATAGASPADADGAPASGANADGAPASGASADLTPAPGASPDGPPASPGPVGSGAPLPAHLHDAARLYGVRAEDLTALGSFESDVYAFDGPGGPRVLKVIAPTHRTPELVQAEVDWLLALLEAGVSVSAPVRAATGAWVERVEGTGHVLVAFERAPGDLVRSRDWTDDLLRRWGRLLGQLQAHSRAWTAPGPRRHTLAEQTYVYRAGEMEAEDPEFVAAARELIAAARPLLLPDAAGLDGGLVHADLHSGNFLAFEDRLTAIDFDDCAYGSYAFDIAMPLYYAVRLQKDRTHAEAAERFLEPFLRGFLEVAPLPAGGARAIDVALRYRQAELVVALRVKLPASRLTETLRAVEKDLRDRVVAGTEHVPLATLERFFG